MAQLVVGGILRCALLGHSDGIPSVVSIMDVDIDTTLGRSFALLEGVAEDVRDNWQDHIVPNFTDHYTFDGISWVDLDTADGLSGEVAPDPAKPLSGGGTADIAPANCAYLIHKNISGATRTRRKGRMYMYGVFEGLVDDAGFVDAGTIAQLDAAFEDFKDGVNGSTGPGDNTNLAVVHNPAVGGTSSSHITTFACDARSASQRDRLRP